METLNIRTSDLVLDRVLNPTRSAELGNARPADILEACGLIPDFFADACLSITFEGVADTLDDLAGAMDNLYGCGGFCYPFGGTIATDGTYASEYDDDPDMAPLCRFGYEGRFFCFVYQYGVTAIRDNTTGQTKIARFD
tara:strand:+ start:90 stop:506 length:417 start_codon:yes stop_codon:yes gene_type:complete